MRICTKCSTALHILTLLSVFEGHRLTSEVLAKSTGCNPVVVRNLLGSMKKAGIVEVRRGAGGALLLMEPKDITVWAVFSAVDTGSQEELIGLHPSPSPECPVGKNIHALLEKPYGIVADSVKEAMNAYTLQQIIDEYNTLQKT